MLESSDAIMRLSAFTKLTREYLPPVDTVDAVMKTKNGVTGTFSVSFGSSNSGSEYTITGDRGYVSASRDGMLQGKMAGSVIVKVGKGESTKKEFGEDGSGVKEEICA
jgi:predicted dehydrogenase